jgi:hypothetical protein
MSIFSPNFIIGSIRIGTIEGASTVSMGNNLQHGFMNHQKINQGLGNISGDGNHIEGLKSLLQDSAILDILGNHTSPDELPCWVQQLVKERLQESSKPL